MGNCNWFNTQGNYILYLKGDINITVINIILHDVLILLFIHFVSLFYESCMLFVHMCPNGTLVQAHPILWKLYLIFIFIPGGISFPHYNMGVSPI